MPPCLILESILDSLDSIPSTCGSSFCASRATGIPRRFRARATSGDRPQCLSKTTHRYEHYDLLANVTGSPLLPSPALLALPQTQWLLLFPLGRSGARPQASVLEGATEGLGGVLLISMLCNTCLVAACGSFYLWFLARLVAQLLQGVRSVIVKVAGRGVCFSKTRASFSFGQ